jgi:glyoxylase-like metal-dependent hydrolase (beta-lactamase superfamily II)
MNKKNYFLVKEMVPDIYGFTNCAVASFLIVGKEKALLFDTGYGVADLKEAVEIITRLPLYVVNSHGHVDHSSGNFRFPGPYYMHKADLDVYHQHNTPEFRQLL